MGNALYYMYNCQHICIILLEIRGYLPGLPTPSGNIHVSSKDINEDTDRSNIPKFPPNYNTCMEMYAIISSLGIRYISLSIDLL